MSESSDEFKNRVDYQMMMNMINTCLERIGPNGSIAFGKKYAEKYKILFEKMLSSTHIDKEILDEMLKMVDNDLEDVRKDCNHRIYKVFAVENDRMMSMIADVVKSSI